MLKNIALLIILSVRLAHAQSKTEVVAAVIVLEAGGEGKNGMLAVHEVISNRAKSNKIDSKYAEIRKPKQFSCLNKISDARAVQIAAKHPAWPMALQIASNKIKSNLVGGAISYHNTSVNPYWSKGKKLKKIGNHLFVID